MANCCWTTYKCVGKLKELRELCAIIRRNERRKQPRVENDFGVLWLGCIIDEMGLDWHDYDCRGVVLDTRLEDDVLTIYQDTAWTEQEGFRLAIEQHFPTIKVYYKDEEPCCDVFTTNDAEGLYFPERFMLDQYEDPKYFTTIKEAANYVSTIVHHSVEPSFMAISDALDDYCEEHDDEDLFFSFHEFSVLEGESQKWRRDLRRHG